MKTCVGLGLFIGLIVARAATDSSPPPFTWIDPADPTVLAIRESGERVMDRVGHTMVYEVERAVMEQGLSHAIAISHLKDLVLPRPEAGQPRITAIRHTSLILRNPANQPDQAEQAALEIINSAIHGGLDVPAILVQRLGPPNGPSEWRVYRAITTKPICLQCHGPLEELLPAVRSILNSKYPEDKAISYTAYQWRGVLRVSFEKP